MATQRELTSLLVSNGDLDAMMQDYGGGYLNNASINGVTLHTGSSEITDQGELLDIRGEGSPRTQRRIESGPLKGLGVRTHEEILTALKKLSEAGLPFAYSMSDKWMNIRYYFMHIPWTHINSSVSFYDLCFGDGLDKVMGGMEGVSEIPRSSNLCEAMIDTRKMERQVLDKRPEERSQAAEKMRQGQKRWSRLLRWLKIR